MRLGMIPTVSLTSIRSSYVLVSLRYWDLYENKYIRFFAGHTAPVGSLSVHPYEDLLLSGSADKSALLWDLRKEKPVARFGTKGSSLGAFDHQGLVFALASGGQRIHLFDSRAYEKAEFTHFDAPMEGNVASVRFSPCGKFILLSSDRGEVLCLDSFKGKLIAGYSGDSGSVLKSEERASPCFSPDSQYVLCGTSKGSVKVWRTVAPLVGGRLETQQVASLEGHSGFPRIVRFNPVRCLLATSCVTTALWLPTNL